VAEYLGREIPHRASAEAMLLEALPADVRRVLDLGTGDGRMAALVRSAHPHCEAVALDASPGMLERARERFADDPRVTVGAHDLAHALKEPGTFDVVVSGLAIHHLEDSRKRALFAEVHALLRPGGAFANLDLVRAPTAEAHERFRQAIGRPQDDPEDRLAGLCEQLDWLVAAGFAVVDCPFKWMQMVLLVAAR
jgi:SAM-dependent methyltransferase